MTSSSNARTDQETVFLRSELTIPDFLRPYFWDIDVASFDPDAYPEYTIQRLLERGGDQAIEWLQQQFSRERIAGVLRTSATMNATAARRWAAVYGIPTEEVAALSPDNWRKKSTFPPFG